MGGHSLTQVHRPVMWRVPPPPESRGPTAFIPCSYSWSVLVRHAPFTYIEELHIWLRLSVKTDRLFLLSKLWGEVTAAFLYYVHLARRVSGSGGGGWGGGVYSWKRIWYQMVSINDWSVVKCLKKPNWEYRPYLYTHSLWVNMKFKLTGWVLNFWTNINVCAFLRKLTRKLASVRVMVSRFTKVYLLQFEWLIYLSSHV